MIKKDNENINKIFQVQFLLLICALSLVLSNKFFRRRQFLLISQHYGLSTLRKQGLFVLHFKIICIGVISKSLIFFKIDLVYFKIFKAAIHREAALG